LGGGGGAGREVRKNEYRELGSNPFAIGP